MHSQPGVLQWQAPGLNFFIVEDLISGCIGYQKFLLSCNAFNTAIQ